MAGEYLDPRNWPLWMSDESGAMPRQQLKTAMQTPFTRGTLAIGGNAIEGFKEGFGDQAIGNAIKFSPEQIEKYPHSASWLRLGSVPFEILGRTLSGGVNAVRHGTGETYT